MAERRWGPEQRLVLPPLIDRWVFLNLRANRLLTNAHPDADSREFHDWQRENGADAGAAAEDKHPRLLSCNLASVRAGSNAFTKVSPATIEYHYDLMTKEPPAQTRLAKNPETGEATDYFRTQDDAWGVLQIIGFTNDPPSVVPRYKRVQNAGPGK